MSALKTVYEEMVIYHQRIKESGFFIKNQFTKIITSALEKLRLMLEQFDSHCFNNITNYAKETVILQEDFTKNYSCHSKTKSCRLIGSLNK